MTTTSEPLVTLVFTNSDATPKVSALRLTAEGVPLVMAWYGSHHAGDRYFVTLDGVRVAKDQNGEPLP
jgi:hypothetical protein